MRGICLRLAVRRRLGFVAGLNGLLDLEQLSHTDELFASVALGEEAVVANAVKAVGQDVEEKAADELVRGETHDAAAAAAPIILVGERHFIVVDGDEPRIGDRRAMRVAGEISEHALGSAERRLGVDDEGALPQRAQALGEGVVLGERGQIAEEAEFASLEGGFEAVEEQPAEGLRQRVNGEQEVRLAGDPAIAVEGEAAAGDETVNVRVVGERLSPSMQHGDQADLGAETFGGKDGERLRRRPHQQAIDGLLVVEGDFGRGRRQGEDDMEVGNRQQFGLARGEPLRPRRPLAFCAVAVATANGRRPLPVLWAKPAMGSWRSR